MASIPPHAHHFCLCLKDCSRCPVTISARLASTTWAWRFGVWRTLSCPSGWVLPLPLPFIHLSWPFPQIWLCGGQVLVAPCSRVGHVFRMRRPYKGKPGMDSSLYNSLRTARVWLDEFEVGKARQWMEADGPGKSGGDETLISDRRANTPRHARQPSGLSRAI